MEETGLPKSVVTTYFGPFKFARMPLRLSNAAYTFQTFVHAGTRGSENVPLYLYDIPVASHSEHQHSAHLHALFNRLSKRSVTVTASKCELEKPGVIFLGYIISSPGLASLPEEVNAIQNYREP